MREVCADRVPVANDPKAEPDHSLGVERDRVVVDHVRRASAKAVVDQAVVDQVRSIGSGWCS